MMWILKVLGLSIGAIGALYGCAELIRCIIVWHKLFDLGPSAYIEIALVSIGIVWIAVVFNMVLPKCMPKR